ncbi:DUF2786 domain-containing protein [Streptomyces yunnanensis]|uniref:DUF2786 domain-containing protein n=1 Tax=Streptomyces yunnanensis TaxID=156453 RepID=A0ABY8A7J5_9ACTN|nr:DUF2786 domain-containing protein [Streptomyces yunnanensis]WEB39522.1 DUF2786 domain-containing protein [Streptomyces yunnanensis]
MVTPGGPSEPKDAPSVSRRLQSLRALAEHPRTPRAERELAAALAAALMKRYGLGAPERRDGIARDGIIVVRLEPDKTVEVLVLDPDAEQATRQIAGIMGRDGGAPVSWNVHRLNAQGLNPGIAVWRKAGALTQQRAVNFMASNITRRGGSLGGLGSIGGTAVVTGYDTATGALASTPLETLEHLLETEAYRDAAAQLRAWRTEHGVSTRPTSTRPRPTALRVLTVEEVGRLTPCAPWEARLQAEIWVEGEWADLVEYEDTRAVCRRHGRGCRECPAGRAWDWHPLPTVDGLLTRLAAHGLTCGFPPPSLSVGPGAYRDGRPAGRGGFSGLTVLTVEEVCALKGRPPHEARLCSQVRYAESREPRMTREHVALSAACTRHGTACRTCAAREWEWTGLPTLDTLTELAGAYSLEPVFPPAALHVSAGTYQARPRPREKREEIA